MIPGWPRAIAQNAHRVGLHARGCWITGRPRARQRELAAEQLLLQIVRRTVVIIVEPNLADRYDLRVYGLCSISASHASPARAA